MIRLDIIYLFVFVNRWERIVMIDIGKFFFLLLPPPLTFQHETYKKDLQKYVIYIHTQYNCIANCISHDITIRTQQVTGEKI